MTLRSTTCGCRDCRLDAQPPTSRAADNTVGVSAYRPPFEVSFKLLHFLPFPTSPTLKSPGEQATMSQPQQPAPPPPPPAEPAMEPPAYTPALPAAPTRSHRSISDLRAQIIANGSVIRPRTDVNKSSDDHIELIVAKTPAPRPTGAPFSSSSGPANPRLHYSEKEAMAALNRASDPTRSMHQPSKLAGASGSGSTGGAQGGGEAGEGRHYAVLVKRSGHRTINVIGMLSLSLLSIECAMLDVREN